MRDPTWKRLGLEADEWRDCRLAAREMSAMTQTRVWPDAVVVEYALARAFDERVVTPTPDAPLPGTRRRAPSWR